MFDYTSFEMNERQSHACIHCMQDKIFSDLAARVQNGQVKPQGCSLYVSYA